jgi:hypothetical protein
MRPSKVMANAFRAGFVRREALLFEWATWVLFGLDFIVPVMLGDHRSRYILRHWLDVLIIALPLLSRCGWPACSQC